jgi:ribosomal protein S18 acetylase RimI-like enzyme
MNDCLIRPYQLADRPTLIPLIAAFRTALAALRDEERAPDPAAATVELQEYSEQAYPIFVAELAVGEIAGYLVCRAEADVVWVESLFVDSAYRRRGIAAQLYEAAEQLAAARGGATLYNWIHPNNEPIIAFLRRRGYDVLNLVEIRRPLPGERLSGRLKVGDQEYRY